MNDTNDPIITRLRELHGILAGYVQRDNTIAFFSATQDDAAWWQAVLEQTARLLEKCTEDSIAVKISQRGKPFGLTLSVQRHGTIVVGVGHEAGDPVVKSVQRAVRSALARAAKASGKPRAVAEPPASTWTPGPDTHAPAPVVGDEVGHG